MSPDELAIRGVHSEWFAATAAGDLPALLSLMTDDVVYVVAGRPPFGRESFAEGFSSALKHFHIACEGDFEEIVVAGNVAYTRTRLEVTMTPRTGGEVKRMAGHALTVYRKEPDGRWLLARDANLLVPV